MLKRTPLFAAHRRLGGKLIEFGGWEMPVHYTSIMEEHLAVRRAAGLFDISHMGEVRVSGPGAAAFLNGLLTNDVRKAGVGRGQYTLMCNDRGGVVDDLYAYHVAEEEYLLIINASRIEADMAWMRSRLGATASGGAVRLENVSDGMGAVAVQGPAVASFIDRAVERVASGSLPERPVTSLAKNEILRLPGGGEPCYFARTGYTGEDGFEIVAGASAIESIWEAVLAEGEAAGIRPCGLGARDTLRTEMCYPLYGHELNEETSPIEAGLAFFVALDKGDFAGRAVLAAQKQGGTSRKLVAFRMAERSAPPRPDYPLWSPEGEPRRIGGVTSGTLSPSLGIGVGMGFVDPAFARPETRIDVEIRSRRFPAVVVPKPIYRKPV